MADPEPGEVRAAGAVIWRAGAQGIETALVHRSRYDDWTFPKGKAMPGEHVLLTAVREVAEEAGVRVALGRRLPSTHYITQGRPKRVDYWAARPVSPDAFAPGDEVDRLDWLPLAAAAGRLSYAHDLAVLDAFAAGPTDTTPMILIRHADAVGRKTWHEAGHANDLARPLSIKGEVDAQTLGPILSTFAPGQVTSSAAQRCLATVGPYAALTDAVVETEPVLTIAGVATEPAAAEWAPTEAARQWITGAVTAGKPVVICGHRQNLPWFLDQACAALGVPPLSGPPLRKGAFWVLQVAGGKGLASAEHHQAGPVAEAPAELSRCMPEGSQSRVAGSAPSKISSHCLTSVPVPPL